MQKKDKLTSLLREMLPEWRWVLGYVGRYKLIVLLYILLGLVGTAMSLGSAVASKYLIDAVVTHNNGVILSRALITAGLALFQFVFVAFSSWMSALAGTKANNEMREEIYSNILSAKWEEIHSVHSGELLNRIEGDVSAVSSGVISFFPNLFTRLLQFFGALVIVLVNDRMMALFSLLSAPFLFISSRFLIKTMRKYNRRSRELNGRVLSFSEESIRNIQVIKAFGLTSRYIENFRSTLRLYRSVKLEYEKFSVIMTFVLSVIGLAVSYLCYGWGVYRLWQGVITFGTMTLFLQLAGSLSTSFSSIASMVPTSVSIATSAGRLMEIAQYGKETDENKKQALDLLEKSKNTGVAVKAENLSFRYSDGNTDILKGVSFTVSPGETIALTGSSGEGKTTMLKLLLGLVEPTEGRLVISAAGTEIPVSDSTRRFCSYVPQDSGIFSGTFAENLRTVRPGATDDEIRDALSMAEIYDYAASLPLGIDTVIGEGGENISAGQAQRIAIARSLLKKAPVLLMDEATSALDEATETRVLRNIMKKDPSKVCILTTHRASMLRYCDRVYRINSDGSMEEVKTKDNESGETGDES